MEEIPKKEKILDGDRQKKRELHTYDAATEAAQKKQSVPPGRQRRRQRKSSDVAGKRPARHSKPPGLSLDQTAVAHGGDREWPRDSAESLADEIARRRCPHKIIFSGKEKAEAGDDKTPWAPSRAATHQTQ